MASGADTNVLVLGRPTVISGGCQRPSLSDQMAECLVLLALAGEEGISTDDLRSGLRRRGGGDVSKSTLQKRISDIEHRLGLDVSLTESGRYGRYYLASAALDVDARRFIQEVRTLDENPRVSVLDDLLGMWRDSPTGFSEQSPLWQRAWRDVRYARETLIDRVAALPDMDRDTLEHLARFTDIFPHDAKVDTIRPRRGGQRSKPRLLIVEDQIAENLCEILDSYATCVTVTSHEEFKVRRDSLDVDAALIDLHLTRGLNDSLGLRVAEYLRDSTDIPAALMTVAMPPGSMLTKPRELCRRYRLVDVLQKEQRILGFEELTVLVNRLVGLEDGYVRARLQCWLDADLYRVEDAARITRSPLEERRLKQAKADFDGAARLVRKARLEDARVAVDRFHATWASRL